MCKQGASWLPAKPPVAAAALQHVNMSVARETGRAHTHTQSIEKPYDYTLFPPCILHVEMLSKTGLLCRPAKGVTGGARMMKQPQIKTDLSAHKG